MTAKIRIIPETLSNKIAAGEVVQRPASVVKELIENSIDAGADEITIEIENAGKRLIKVSDNGIGMERNDALLSIERFATSKLKSENDLFNIRTLGFRGEALPSIASVSRLSLTTKTKNDVEGTHLLIDGGRLKDVKDVGAPTGTAIEVRRLFYNTPARLKFMKSNQVEMFHITDVILKMAASQHDKHIRLISDGRSVLDFTKAQDIYNRICDIFTSNIYKHLIKIDEQSEDIHVFGYVSNPVYTTKNAKKFFTYINGRYVSDKIINFAINSAYRSKIEERKYPAVVLFIEMPLGEVDVNVHPTKKDVRFRNQRLVIGYIESAIKNAFSSAQLVGLAGMTGPERFKPAPPANSEEIKRSMRAYMEGALRGEGFDQSRKGSYLPGDKGESARDLPYEHSTYDHKVGEDRQAQSAMYGDYIKILGQIGAAFIICSKGENLLLIDQHAAHERILFDELYNKYAEKRVIAQPLLIPIIFEVSKSDALVLEGYLEELSAIGFLIEPVGKASYAVKEVPDILIGYDYKEIIHDLISDLMHLDKSGDIKDKLTNLMKLVACKGAIKANRKLTEAEIMGLLHDISTTDYPTNCPHGRPVVIELTQKDLRKMFKRL